MQRARPISSLRAENTALDALTRVLARARAGDLLQFSRRKLLCRFFRATQRQALAARHLVELLVGQRLFVLDRRILGVVFRLAHAVPPGLSNSRHSNLSWVKKRAPRSF